MMELEEEIGASLAGRVWQTTLKMPGNTALELGERQFSYRELYNAAASLSQSICELDDPSPYVAVMADKSFACYTGILGILMAGKAYLPLNPRFPASRNLYMLEKAKVRVILAGDNSDDELEQILENHSRDIFIIFPEEIGNVQDTEFKPKIVEPETPAYLLFTSGTTGQPKGVPVSQGNVAAYLDFMLQHYDFNPDDRFTQIFDLTFDLSVHDLFLAWSSGACLVVPEDNSSFAMSRFIREKTPTVFFAVPSVVNLMDRMRLLKPGLFPSIRLSFFCGEALQVKTVRSWKTAAPQSKIVNLYGPTEATIAVSLYELPDELSGCKNDLGIVAIGKLFDGNIYRIIREVQADEHGELCLSGLQIVHGYLGDPQADHQSFFYESSTSLKFYKTGDLVKIDEAGDLFYTGRKDSEVKISGYRVNLKEIESVLEKYEKVRQAVVMYEQKDDSAGTILAFILAVQVDKLIEEKALDALCREYLPWYMVPGKYIFVDEIPLNDNGKTDKAALKKKYCNGN